jgi:hypothetical protein
MSSLGMSSRHATALERLRERGVILVPRAHRTGERLTDTCGPIHPQHAEAT